tara:strand:- start:233 stop:601 length:369 start_codon:yes stop_codon:yes gene_type:complete
MKIYYTIIGFVSLLTFRYSYNYLIQKNLYKKLIFSNLSEEKYLIFCKNIDTYCKTLNINTIYQIIIDAHLIELPIEKFTYNYDKNDFIFYPIIEKNKLVGYNIQYNEIININKLINYVLNNK